MLLSWQEISHIFLLAAMLLVTPGPTNTLLLFSGATSGILKVQKLIAAEVVGYFIAISIWGFVMAILNSYLPGVVVVVKIFGVMYILWLAVKIWRFQQQEIIGAVIVARHVFFTTLFNPKAFVVVAYIMPKEVFLDVTLYSGAMLIFFCALLPVSALWCAGGRFIYLANNGRVTQHPVFFRLISLTLAVFALLVLYRTLIERFQ